MKEFIITNWTSMIAILIFVSVLIFLTLRGKKDIVAKMLFALVTEAEKIYGGGTGSVKLAYVVEKAYSYLPSVLKVFITYKRLKQMIEDALTAAKIKWTENPSLADYLKEPQALIGELANTIDADTEFLTGKLVDTAADISTPADNKIE